MRLPAQRIIRAQVARTVSVPAPVGGWNARDSLADMDKRDAVVLDNLFPTVTDVRARKGFTQHATGISGLVRSLMSYSPPSGNARLFAVSDSAAPKLYDATSSGVLSGPSVSGFANGGDKFQHAMFGTSGGNFLVAVNGTDLPIVYNGSAWGNVFPAAFNTAVSTLTNAGTTYTCTMSAAHNLKTGMTVTIAGATSAAPNNYNGTFVITVTGASAFTYTNTASGAASAGGTITATPSVSFNATGVTLANLININAHKRRLFFIEKNSMKAWYNTAVESIGGTLAAFDLASFMTRGGYLVAMGTWTLDVGFGIDDYAVFISSEGQVAVYEGTDPADPTKWALIGVYQVGSPIGYRCFTKYGGDLFLILKEGLTPLSMALKTEADTNNRRVTAKIQNAVNEYTQQYAGYFGWQCLLYPSENMLLLNIPATTTGSESVQLAMNTITGSWCRFTGWDAACWERHNDEIYFGSTDFVGQAWDTYADNGNFVQFQGLQSFNPHGANTQMKQVKMLRPVIATDGSPGVLMGVNADFDQSAPIGLLTSSPVTAGVWDSGLWDVAMWGGDPTIFRNWQTAFSMGYSFAAHLVGKTSLEQFRWIATDYLIQDAGVI